MNIQFLKKPLCTLREPRNYPLLIGCGEHDIPMELTAVEMWKSTEQDASVAIFDGAGHCVNMDVPDEFNKVLESFLKKWKITVKKSEQ